MRTLILLSVVISCASAYRILKGESEFEKIRDSLHRLSDETRDLDTSEHAKKSIHDHIQDLTNKLYKVHDAFLEKERLNDYRHHNSHAGPDEEKVGKPLKNDAPAKIVERVGKPLINDAPSKVVEMVGKPLHHDAPVYRDNNANLLEQLDEIDEEEEEEEELNDEEEMMNDEEEEEFKDVEKVGVPPPPPPPPPQKQKQSDHHKKKDFKFLHKKHADYVPAAFKKDEPPPQFDESPFGGMKDAPDSGEEAFKKAVDKEVKREKASKRQHDAVKDEIKRKVEDLVKIVSQLKDTIRSKVKK